MSCTYRAVDQVGAADYSSNDLDKFVRSTFRREFLNFTSHRIGVITREGLRHIYEPCKGKITESFAIMDIWHFTPEEAGRHLDELVRAPQSTIRATMINALRRQMRDPGKRITIRIKHTVKYKEIHQGDILSYLPALDIVLYDAELHRHARHPYGRTVEEEAVMLPNTSTTVDGGINFSVCIIDNNKFKRASTKFINIAGEVYPVEPKCDDTLDEGVHLTCTRPVTHSDEEGMAYVRYTLEDGVSRLNMFDTVDEAKRNGDGKEIQKKLADALILKKEKEKIIADIILTHNKNISEAIKTIQAHYSNIGKILKELLTIGGSIIGVIGTLLLTISRLKT